MIEDSQVIVWFLRTRYYRDRLDHEQGILASARHMLKVYTDRDFDLDRIQKDLKDNGKEG